MYADRVARLTTAAAGRGLAAIALMPSANLRYFTGLTFHAGKRLTLALLPADGAAPCMVLPSMDAARARAGAGIALDLFPWTDAEGPGGALHEALARVLGGAPDARIGVEDLAMRVMEMRALERAGAALGCRVETVDAGALPAAMRMIKDEQELAAMAEAARLVETALRGVIAQIRPGMTERQLSALITRAIMESGAEGESFENIAGGGPNSANPHHANSGRPLQNGDLIVIDCGAVYQGYASDITRTVALGEPGPQARRIYELVQAANAAGRAALRPGATGEEVDRAARRVIYEGGYGDRFPHRTGHGLGLELHPCHEPPDLVEGNSTPLVAGTVVTVEPGIYLDGVGGVRIEDDMVVTADGARSLTSFERDLIVI
jgi:Xaa-Pro aminopeptidase